jgi:hypothetical protein
VAVEGRVGEGWRMVVDGRMRANGRGARGLGVSDVWRKESTSFDVG